MKKKQTPEVVEEQVLTYAIDDLVSERFNRYAKYIILDRALPDVRDGLKPVQRRILYAMNDLGLTADKSYKKSARVIGEVIGKYHPHGDVPVYGAMVRMAQPWKSRIPLIDMQGNKGSIDGDGPAAMRYTETKLSSIAQLLLNDLKKDVVTFVPNFDEAEKEPVVLPAYFPNLLVNGATGIAVGIATNIPPHNLGEIIEALIYRINNPGCTLTEIMKLIKGPDFPTGGIISGVSGIKTAYKTGKGRIAIRAKTSFEIKEKAKKEQRIVIHELPYEVVKQDLVKKIDDVRALNKIHGIKEVRDETDRHGLRIIIELTSDANAHEILNYLLKHTNLQVFYNLNLVAIAAKKPQQLSLMHILDYYLNHQKEVVIKRSQYELKELERRLEIITGLVIALSQIDKVIKLIRASTNRESAKQTLIKEIKLSNIQAEAVVQLRLYRLSATDVKTLETEKGIIETTIVKLKKLLKQDKVLNQHLIDSFNNIKENFNKPRRSVISGEIKEIVIDEKATMKQVDLFVTISYDGWIKTINNRLLNDNVDYKEFGRKPNDIIIAQGIINNLENLLLITSKGNYIVIPSYKLVENKWKDVGTHLNTLCKLDSSEKIIACAVINNFQQKDVYLVLVSKLGLIKRIELAELDTVRFAKTLKCISLSKEDSLVNASFTDGHKWIVLTTREGFTLKYSENQVSILGLPAKGIKAAKLVGADFIVGSSAGSSSDVYGVLTSTGTFKRLNFSSITQVGRTTKGQKIVTVPKNKPYTIISTFKANDKIRINLLTNQDQWKYLWVEDAPITRVSEGMGKAVSDSVFSASNIYLWNLRTQEDIETNPTLTLEMTQAPEVNHDQGEKPSATEEKNQDLETKTFMSEIEDKNNSSWED